MKRKLLLLGLSSHSFAIKVILSSHVWRWRRGGEGVFRMAHTVVRGLSGLTPTPVSWFPPISPPPLAGPGTSRRRARPATRAGRDHPGRQCLLVTFPLLVPDIPVSLPLFALPSRAALLHTPLDRSSSSHFFLATAVMRPWRRKDAIWMRESASCTQWDWTSSSASSSSLPISFAHPQHPDWQIFEVFLPDWPNFM